jgi:hypothetical protein
MQASSLSGPTRTATRGAFHPLGLPGAETLGPRIDDAPIAPHCDHSRSFQRRSPGCAARRAWREGAIQGTLDLLLLEILTLEALHGWAIGLRLRSISGDVLQVKGLMLVGTGTAIGLAIGFAVEHLMNSMLFSVQWTPRSGPARLLPLNSSETAIGQHVPRIDDH